MLHRTTTAMLLFLGALNAAMLLLNVSLPSSAAAVAGLNVQALLQDADFQLAVRSVIEGCRVLVSVGKAKCDHPPYPDNVRIGH